MDTALIDQVHEGLADTENPLPDYPRINTYCCRSCGGQIHTVDCADGTTPMTLGCLCEEGKESTIVGMDGVPVRPRCNGVMVSAFYSATASRVPLSEVAYEWRLPTMDEFRKTCAKHRNLGHHLLQGGLLLAKRSASPVLTHGGKFIKDGEVMGPVAMAVHQGKFAEIIAFLASARAEMKKKEHAVRMRKQAIHAKAKRKRK